MLNIVTLLICVSSAINAYPNQVVLTGTNAIEPPKIGLSETLDVYAHRVTKFCASSLFLQDGWCNSTAFKIRHLNVEQKHARDAWFASHYVKRRTLLLNENVCYEEHLSKRLEDLYFEKLLLQFTSNCSNLAIQVEVDVSDSTDPQIWINDYLNHLVERVEKSQRFIKRIDLKIRLNAISDDLVADNKSIEVAHDEYKTSINAAVQNSRLASLVKLKHLVSDRVVLPVSAYGLQENVIKAVKSFLPKLVQPSLAVVFDSTLGDYRQEIDSLRGIGDNLQETLIVPSKYLNYGYDFHILMMEVVEEPSLVGILNDLKVAPHNFGLAAILLLANQLMYFQGPLLIWYKLDFLKVDPVIFSKIPHDRDLTVYVSKDQHKLSDIQKFFVNILPTFGAANLVLKTSTIPCADVARLKIGNISSHLNLVLFQCFDQNYRRRIEVLYKRD
ncbi:hypothetical protein MP228_006697 [Amoeboaphelidium protococcarum]|nr:hypothetical protein MP228_006697 [Amoeboaphelidium protococcarum]